VNLRRATIICGALLAVVLLGAGSCDSAANKDRDASNAQLDKYQHNQPIPNSDWSQYRQTIIDVENAQIHAVATTTFFFNQGTPKPIKSCPSIGFPVPTTAQLTNPQQAVGNGAVIGQLEPNGVYTGDSTGTYVICIAPNGTKYISYWEGDVQTEGGPAHWDDAKAQIVLDGAPTVTAKTK
jgi:hypothetical protein